MSTKLGSTGVVFPGGTEQTAKYDSTDDRGDEDRAYGKASDGTGADGVDPAAAPTPARGSMLNPRNWSNPFKGLFGGSKKMA